MFILGLVCLLLGFLLGIHILWVIGLILMVVGAVLLIVDLMGHRVGGRRWY